MFPTVTVGFGRRNASRPRVSRPMPASVLRQGGALAYRCRAEATPTLAANWPSRDRALVRRKIMRLILIVVLILLLLGALPTWPYSAGWGYYPSGGLGLILLVLLILVVLGRI